MDFGVLNGLFKAYLDIVNTHVLRLFDKQRDEGGDIKSELSELCRNIESSQERLAETLKRVKDLTYANDSNGNVGGQVSYVCTLEDLSKAKNFRIR